MEAKPDTSLSFEDALSQLETIVETMESGDVPLADLLALARRIETLFGAPQDIEWVYGDAGFEIVDCPPLTAQLKNSSDIRMVMDVRDYLTNDTYFDEFVILSPRVVDPVQLQALANAAMRAGKGSSDLYIADEIFVCGTAAEVSSVNSVDDRVVPCPGPVGRAQPA